ncbi:basic proline-rich protein-like [Melozone crissalis]|uniref:basic proline-rich protein-like n=1 Tax=Melozone crissalis TaxID=40204 RepID=UPI0023DA9418|nr:basic proline-rich protein-like [Melozone crissalis]
MSLTFTSLDTQILKDAAWPPVFHSKGQQQHPPGGRPRPRPHRAEGTTPPPSPQRRAPHKLRPRRRRERGGAAPAQRGGRCRPRRAADGAEPPGHPSRPEPFPGGQGSLPAAAGARGSARPGPSPSRLRSGRAGTNFRIPPARRAGLPAPAASRRYLPGLPRRGGRLWALLLRRAAGPCARARARGRPARPAPAPASPLRAAATTHSGVARTTSARPSPSPLPPARPPRGTAQRGGSHVGPPRQWRRIAAGWAGGEPLSRREAAGAIHSPPPLGHLPLRLSRLTCPREPPRPQCGQQSAAGRLWHRTCGVPRVPSPAQVLHPVPVPRDPALLQDRGHTGPGALGWLEAAAVAVLRGC